MSRRGILLSVAASSASAVAASTITYFVTKKSLDRQYEKRLSTEVTESVKFIINNSGGAPIIVSDENVEDILDEYNSTLNTDLSDDALSEKVFGSESLKPSLDELAARNHVVRYDKILSEVKDDEPQEEDIPEEIAEDDPNITVISRDIFMENGTEWEQDTLTYFADGGVLDVQGDFVEDHFNLIGTGVPRFGELSGDKNIVYIRNKKIEKEFEIISDPGNASDFLIHSLSDIYKPSWKK